MRGVWVSLIVGIIVLAGVFYVYSTNVTVRRVVVSIQYGASESGYITSNIDLNGKANVYGLASYTYSGFTASGIKQRDFQIALASNSTQVHQINSIQVSSVGFTIISRTPPGSIPVPSKNLVPTISLVIQCPLLGYDGDLQVTVYVI